MRPVERGAWPQTRDGSNVEFSHYRDARNELATRLGFYCSYCEMPKQEAIDVEHMAPKARAPHLERDWHNFLLACTACNSRKSDNPDPSRLDSYLWPDRDNTFAAIVWHDGFSATVSDKVSGAVAAKAAMTIQLTRLNATEPLRPKLKDLRRYHRMQAHSKALLNKVLLENEPHSSGLRTSIAMTAVATGYFSVWMHVFADDPDMRRRFIDAFPGTARDCFDTSGNPVNRPGGRI